MYILSLSCKNDVVREFSHPFGDCITDTNYISHTCTTLSRRLTCHMSTLSAIRANIGHHVTKQNKAINIRHILVDITKILYRIHFK